MNSHLRDYIARARDKGLSDSDIRQRLLDAGWGGREIYLHMEDDEDLVPPSPRSTSSSSPDRKQDESLSVVSSGFSGSGFEYLIYFLALGIVALAVGSMLHSIVNVVIDTDKFSFYREVIPYSTAALAVTGPVYIWLMLRLKKRESANPQILNDPSRRRAVQFLLLVTFLIGIIKLIAYVFNLINAAGATTTDVNLLAETLHAMITIGLAGGIFWKYFGEQSRLE